MEFISQISAFGGTVVSYILPFLFVLTIVVFFHELGHFLVARYYGVEVKAFSIGFGGELFGYTDKLGTRWKVCWIPLGGYVKFMDDENAASMPDQQQIKAMNADEKARSFHAKPLYQRAAIVAAGPFANFILAIVIFAMMFTFIGRMTTTPRVDVVMPDSAAEEAGFKPGDKILYINDTKIKSFNDMQRIVSVNADTPLLVRVDRSGELIELTVTPKRREITDRFGNKVRIGLIGIKREAKPDDYAFERSDPFTALWLGTKETFFVIERTLAYIYDIIIGKESTDQLGGPIRIAQVSGNVASAGILALINLSAVLSISIGLLNLFPIPMLDGGHLLYYGIEALRGKPLSEQAQEIGFRIGLAFVLMLMIFATWNDLIQLRFL